MQPFFSIVIPTKNRSFLIGNAIDSVLSQSYRNFELIIADNDDTRETNRVVAAFRDSRIHYYKTGNLSMPDNWEYGVSKITGDYLIILQDKMQLKVDALLRLYEIILCDNPAVIKWQHDFTDEETGKRNPNFLIPYFNPGFIESEKITRMLLDSEADRFSRYAPIGIDTCVSTDIVKKIRLGKHGRLCIPISPDYTAAYQILHTVDKIYCTPAMLTTMTGMKHGNGISFFTRGTLGKQFIKEMGMEEHDLHCHAPLPVLTTFNSVINDYAALYGLDELNLDNYYQYLYRELRRMEAMGVDVLIDMAAWKANTTAREPVSLPDSLSQSIALLTNGRYSEMARYVIGGMR